MVRNKKHITLYSFLVLICFILIYMHLFAGQIDLTINDYIDGIFSSKQDSLKHIIAREIRIPRMLLAITAGGGLALAGLLMQTLFNNPLAGPYVLGINSGASLFVSITLMTGIPLLNNDFGIVTSALIGALFFGVIILFFAKNIRFNISLLLVGLMLGSFTNAIISILQTYSQSEDLKQYTLWAMGSLQQASFLEGILYFFFFIILVIATLFMTKSLNLLVLGESAAKLQGVNFKRMKILIIIVTSLLTGAITSICGPIAFVGLAIPNLVKILFKTQDHFKLIFLSVMFGVIFILCCDIVIQLLENKIVLPINILTSLIGAPFVVFLLLKKVR